MPSLTQSVPPELIELSAAVIVVYALCHEEPLCTGPGARWFTYITAENAGVPAKIAIIIMTSLRVVINADLHAREFAHSESSVMLNLIQHLKQTLKQVQGDKILTLQFRDKGVPKQRNCCDCISPAGEGEVPTEPDLLRILGSAGASPSR
jgi:hypothetical protein